MDPVAVIGVLITFLRKRRASVPDMWVTAAVAAAVAPWHARGAGKTHDRCQARSARPFDRGRVIDGF